MIPRLKSHIIIIKKSSFIAKKILAIKPQTQICFLSTSTTTFNSNPNFREIPIKLETRNGYSAGKTIPLDRGKERSTYSSEEVNKFKTLADSWWDSEGDCKPLHSLNKLRIALIRDGLIATKATNPAYQEGPQPLKGIRILDVGCGGGILCEPLARLGAEVTGLDASEVSVQAAELHAQKDKRVFSNVRYIQGTVEKHAEEVSTPYDALIASEVLEHVKSVDYFLETCVSLLRPGGSFFITTINRTTKAYLGAILLGEYVLGLLPRGTHDWNNFVPPQDLMFLLKRNNCNTTLVHGMFYLPIRNEWFWVSDPSVNYALHAVKSRQQR